MNRQTPTQPPEDGRDMMVKLKDLKDIYVAFNHPKEIGGSITVLGLGFTGCRPWEDVEAWWPMPSLDDLEFIKCKDNINDFVFRLKVGDVTCIDCPRNKTCPYRWDFYNTNGDCLAIK